MFSKHILGRVGVTLLIATATLGTAGASPVASDPSKAVKPVVVVPAKASSNTKYCVVSTMTGSRIPQKLCRTRDDWIAMTGFDPLADKQ